MAREAARELPRTVVGRWLFAQAIGDRASVAPLARKLNAGERGWHQGEAQVVEACCSLAIPLLFPKGYEHERVRQFADHIYAMTGSEDSAGVLKRGNLEYLIRVFLGDALFQDSLSEVERFICEGVMFVQAVLDLRLNREASVALILNAEGIVAALGVDVPSAASQGVV